MKIQCPSEPLPSTLQQAQAEQEEEYISNTLLKKIHSLKKEKEALAMNYEQEEEFLTNDLSRKLAQVCALRRGSHKSISVDSLASLGHFPVVCLDLYSVNIDVSIV